MMPAATFAAPRGRMPTIEWIPIDELEIDDSYQRSIATRASTKLIEAIARDWDWDLFDVLKVSIRPDDRRFVVDGQHRRAAARLRGDITQLPCVLKRCAGPGEEARLFIAANRGRKTMSGLDDFRAAVGAGDPIAVRIEAMVTAAGLAMARASSPKGLAPGELAIVAPIRAALKMRGESVTAKALDLIGAAFPDEVLISASCLFGALVDLLALTDVSEDVLLHTLLTGTSKDWEEWAALPALRGGGRTEPRDACGDRAAAGRMTGRILQRPVPIDPRALRRRERTGAYPFVQHRTRADWSPAEFER